jgi:hypothetical protein
LLLIALPLRAHAGEPVHVEADGDPAAFFVDGFSLHVAVVGPWQRLDFGCYSIDEPHFLHGQDGWSTEMRGYGLNWDYFFFADGGLFAGLGVNLVVRTYLLDDAGLSAERHQLIVGPHLGWRFWLGDHLYLAPWLAVEYAYRGDEVRLANQRFDDRPYVIFPTVYMGWRFR